MHAGQSRDDRGFEYRQSLGTSYRLAHSSVSVEGEWELVFLLIQKCHERVREQSSHVITTVSIQDEEGAIDKLGESSRSVEGKISHTESVWNPKIRNIKPSKDQLWG